MHDNFWTQSSRNASNYCSTIFEEERWLTFLRGELPIVHWPFLWCSKAEVNHRFFWVDPMLRSLKNVQPIFNLLHWWHIKESFFSNHFFFISVAFSIISLLVEQQDKLVIMNELVNLVGTFTILMSFTSSYKKDEHLSFYIYDVWLCYNLFWIG